MAELAGMNYRQFDGVEFYSVIVHSTKKSAQDVVDCWEREYRRGRGAKGFPLRSRIIKVKNGWRAYTNNTVRNVNFWERYGKIPRNGR